MLIKPFADQLAATLERQSGDLNSEMLEDILQRGERAKGGISYDLDMAARRRHYEGRAQGDLRAELMKRFPNNADKMHLPGLNRARQIADQDASVYDYEPRRFLVDEGGEPLKQGDEAVRRFEALVDAARLDSVMLEVDRRLQLANSLVLKLEWDAADDIPVIRKFWPCDIYPVPHPRWPTRWDRLVALAARIGPVDGSAVRKRDEEWFDVWWRRWDEAAGFGPWFHQQMRRDGSSVRAFGAASETANGPRGMYPLPRFPYLCAHRGDPDCGPFVDMDRDLVDALKTINAIHADEIFTVAAQAHAELALFMNGKSAPETKVVGGPGQMMGPFPESARIDVLNPNAPIGEIRLSRESMVEDLAILRRQPRYAYSSKRASIETGVKLRLEQEPQDKKRREDAKFMRAFEREQLLPALMELHDEFALTDFRFREDAEGARPEMVVAEPPDFEDPMVKLERAIRGRDAGLYSEAEAAVVAGIHPDVATAVQHGYSDARGRAPEPAPPMPLEPDEAASDS